MKRDETDQVTIVIPQLKKTKLTRQAVSEIRKYERQVNILVLVNDERDFPLIEGANMMYTRDLNLSRSWNTGIKATATQNIILLNNDIRCKGEFVEELSSLNKTHISGTCLRDDVIAPGKYLEGWCLSFRKSLWKDVGGFNETMELYCSDTYFQFLAMMKGIQLKKCNVPLVHLGHRTAHDVHIRPDRVSRFVQDTRILRKKMVKHAKD